MANNPEIKYINRTYSSLKSDLIEFARSYYPESYNDFSTASPGSMFIDMAAYVGDVLSFYLDNQIQETYRQHSKQIQNLYSMAYTMGYRPKVTSVSIVELDVYQQVPAIGPIGQRYPDFNYAVSIESGMVVRSNVNNSIFYYCPDRLDFSISSSVDPTEVSVYSYVGTEPDTFLLKKKTYAISAEPKSQEFSFGAAERFSKVTITDNNIVGITNAIDVDGNIWHEVPYLAQDYIIKSIQNTQTNFPEFYQFSNQVPYMIRSEKVDRRFTTRFRSDESLEIEFGSGIDRREDSLIVPNPHRVGLGITQNPTTFISSAFDPTTFVTTRAYGLAPSNTTITISYLVGGGVTSNVSSNELTQISSIDVRGDQTFANTIAVNNELPSSGGSDGETVEQLRKNIALEFSSQLRAVTQQDYMSRVLSMPQKYGSVSKIYLTKDDEVFTNYNSYDSSEKDPVLVSMYILSLDSFGKLALPTEPLMKNIQTYLSEYRMMTDFINIKPAFIINIGVDFDIILRPGYVNTEVLANCILKLKEYFNINNWEINQPIILSNIYSILDRVEGVQTVKRVDIKNLYGESQGYSKYGYDIKAGTIGGIIYPSLDPSIFEVKYPDIDIKGRIVTF